MTQYIPLPNPKDLVNLSGTIRNLEVKRSKANFRMAEEEETRSQKATGIVAIFAALAGAGGAAMSTAANNKVDIEEADYVTFDLEAKPMKGWLKYTPFKDGDEVHVAAQAQGEHWDIYAVARPIDRMIALYPNCKRSKIRHIQTILKAWLILGGGG